LRVPYLEERTALADRERHDSLETLAGGVAHDFNNLLMAVLGNLELVKDELDPAAQRAGVDAAESAALRARDLAGQMMAYVRGRPTEMSDVDLTTLAEDMRPLLETVIPKAVPLQIEIEGECTIAGDETQIAQVLMNLVKNAGEAVSEGEGRVRVAISQERDVALLRVIDNGCGMDGETARRIFDPFYSRKSTGRGLGLASVHGIVRAHKGEIAVSSSPGNGTTFSVRLPLA
jgi:two-component system, cell cycle sensor histidine kinase and response regulator CckA